MMQTEKYEQEVTIEVDEEPAVDENGNVTVNQSIMVEHLATMKLKIDQSTTELFYAMLVRSLASIAIALATILFASFEYLPSVLYPIITGEAAIVLLIGLLAKSKWKSTSNKSKIKDSLKFIESLIIVGICFLPRYAVIFMICYVMLSLVSWKVSFFEMLNAINETFLLQLVFLILFS